MQTLAADSSTAPVTAAGRFLMAAGGTFGGGTAKVEISPDDGTTWATFGVGFTTAAALEVPVPQGAQARVTLTGSTSPSLKVGWSALPLVP